MFSEILYNSEDILKEVPERLQDLNGDISDEKLKEFVGEIIIANHGLKKVFMLRITVEYQFFTK